MNIIVFGANGGVGKEVVRQVLDAKHIVTAFVRDPAKLPIQHPNLTITQGDGLDEKAVISAIKGHDAVICCVGGKGLGSTTLMSDITKNIISGMEQNGVKRIAYVATAGIHKELPGIMGSMIAWLLRNPIADHRRSYELLHNSNLDWTIARPMSLTNDAFTGKYREADSGIPKGGQRISRADVAHFLLKAITDDSYIHKSVGLAY